MKVDRGDRHVTVTRWVMDSTPPPFFEKAGGFAPDDHVDRWQHITWTPPAFVRLDVGAATAGTGAIDGERGRSLADYQFLRGLDTDPKVRLILWDGKKWREISGDFRKPRSGTEFKDYPKK